MGDDYIPERDVRASSYMKNFARRLVEQPSLYRIAPEDAAELDQAVLAFRLALIEARRPGITSKSLTTKKNLARKAAEKLVRFEAKRIKSDPRIAPELKPLLGLKKREKPRQFVPPPPGVPWLSPRAEMWGRMTISVRDSESRRARCPADAVGLELYEWIAPANSGDGVASSPALDAMTTDKPTGKAGPPSASSIRQWRFVGTFSKWPIRFYPGSDRPGQQIWYVACWVTRKGLRGELGNPVMVYSLWNGAPTRSGPGIRSRRGIAA